MLHFIFLLSLLSKISVSFVMLLYEQECTENLIKDILNKNPSNQTN